MKSSRWILFSMLVLSLSTQAHEGHQFRSFNPIASEQNEKQALPDGAVPLKQTQPLSREDVEPLVRGIVEKWNSPEMSDVLSDQFYDKSRLLDVMDTTVPRDAKLHLESIQGVQTLQQYQMTNENGRSDIVSIVSATARTRLEFNSTSGFQRRVGTNEFILKITQAASP